jgi:hypothetical protein
MRRAWDQQWDSRLCRLAEAGAMPCPTPAHLGDTGRTGPLFLPVLDLPFTAPPAALDDLVSLQWHRSLRHSTAARLQAHARACGQRPR